MNKFLVAIILLFFQNSNASDKITCPDDLVGNYGCDQCESGKRVYEGNKDGLELWDFLINNGGSINRIYESNTKSPYTQNHYGTGIVTFTEISWNYSSDFFKNCGGGWCTTPSGKRFVFLKPGDKLEWIRSKTNYGLGVIKVDKSKINNLNRENIRDRNFVIVYQHNVEYRSNPDQKQILGQETMNSCYIIGVHFCGDGYIEPNKESCDDGQQNGQKGKCNDLCTGFVEDK